MHMQFITVAMAMSLHRVCRDRPARLPRDDQMHRHGRRRRGDVELARTRRVLGRLCARGACLRVITIRSTHPLLGPSGR